MQEVRCSPFIYKTLIRWHFCAGSDPQIWKQTYISLLWWVKLLKQPFEEVMIAQNVLTVAAQTSMNRNTHTHIIIMEQWTGKPVNTVCLIKSYSERACLGLTWTKKEKRDKELWLLRHVTVTSQKVSSGWVIDLSAKVCTVIWCLAKRDTLIMKFKRFLDWTSHTRWTCNCV